MADREYKDVLEEANNVIKKKTYTVKELAQALGVSENKARQLTHAKDFPVLVLGRTRLTVISKLNSWLEENIGGSLIWQEKKESLRRPNQEGNTRS